MQTLAHRHLREHIRCTYLDRQIYWNLRSASRGYQDVLVIIIDAMDKTKFAWPRWPFSQVPHDLAGIVRPRLVFYTAMAHGFCIDMYMAAEELNHGSNAFCEILCRTIVNVREQCTMRRIPFPRHLVIQSDNTVAQAKNQYAALFLAVLVSRGLFLSVDLMFLVVGHTHEDIDQFFGIIVALILQLASFQTPAELMRYLLERLTAKFAAKNEMLHGTALTAIRDFQKWLAPLNRTLWHAFGNRQGVEAPHTFTFKARDDLSKAERAWFGRQGVEEGHRHDVYVCVKTYMHSTTLQQEPLMVLPHSREDRLQGEPQEICSRSPFGDKRVKELIKLKSQASSRGLPDAAIALHAYIFDRSFTLPRLPWLRNGWTVDRADHGDSGHYFFPHLPASSWRLFTGDKSRE